MAFLDLAKARYSARKYASRRVEQEKLAAILEAGRVAPTAANKQPQRVLVVQEQAGMAKLAETANVYGAPLVLIVVADTKEAWMRPVDTKVFADIDASVVTTHMMLEAADLGLGSVWIGIFDPKSIKRNFNLPQDTEPVAILAIGYPECEPQSPDRHDTARKALKQTVVYETF